MFFLWPKIFWVLFLSTAWIQHVPCNGAKILFGHGPQSLSHFRSMLPLAKRLAERGHEVTVFHTFAKAHKQVNNSGLVHILPIHREPAGTNIDAFTKKIWSFTFRGYMLMIPSAIIGGISPSYLQNHPTEVMHSQLQDVMKKASKIVGVLNTDWDLVVTSLLFNVHTRAFVEILGRRRGIPHAIMSTLSMLPSSSYKFSMGHQLASLPAQLKPPPRYFDDAFDPTDFMTRAENVFERIGDYVSTFMIDNVFFPPMLRKFGINNFDSDRFFASAPLAFTDMPEFVSFPAPQITSVRSTGAYCDRSSELSPEFRSFMEDPKSKGTIYIAFGTIVAWDQAPDEIKRAFFDAIDALTDYRVIFAYKGTPPQRRIPPHVRVVMWAPQLNILAHPTTKVFLTHGGLKSVKEGLCTMTPMLVLPLFAEQGHNAQLLMRLGLGGALYKYALSRDTILESLHRILDRADDYVARARKLRAMFLDRPLDELDDGVFYVERLIRRLSRRAPKSPLSANSTEVPKYPSRCTGDELFFRSRGMATTLVAFLYADVLAAFIVLAITLATK